MESARDAGKAQLGMRDRRVFHSTFEFPDLCPDMFFPTPQTFRLRIPPGPAGNTSINTQPILPQYQKEKEPSSRLPQGLSRSATSVTLPAFLFHLFVFPLCREETCDPFSAFFPTNSSFYTSPFSSLHSSFFLQRFSGPLLAVSF